MSPYFEHAVRHAPSRLALSAPVLLLLPPPCFPLQLKENARALERNALMRREAKELKIHHKGVSSETLTEVGVYEVYSCT